MKREPGLLDWLRIAAARVAGLFSKRRSAFELDQELGAHLDQLREENIRRGMTPEEARHAARRAFGGVEQIKEAYREQRGLPFLETLFQDVRYGMRVLGKTPGFTAVAILTLAIGMGANTAIFSVVHSVLLQPFPYPNPDRLAIVWSIYGHEGRAPASGPELIYLRERSRLFEELGGIWAQSGALTGEGQPEQVSLGLVTANFLSLLSAKPQLGRFFLPGEQGSGAARVIILSDRLWRRRFGADPGLLGRSVRLDAEPFTVVGVMPPGFKMIAPEGASVPPDLDVYLPFPTNLATDPRDQAYIRVLGRLKKGVTIQQAQSEAEEIAGQLRREFTEFSELGLGLRVVPLHDDVVRKLRPALLALFAGVGFVLLIACANVANLLLSRASQRQREITLRTALGAARGRVICQLLTESVLLSSMGGAAALLVGWCALKLLLTLRPPEMERLGSIGLNVIAFAFTSTISVIAGILFGLAPALAVTRVNLVESLKEGGRAIATGKRHSRNLLVVSEVALGFVLLMGAGLMTQTFAGLLRVDPGFAPTSVLTFHLSVASVKYRTPESAVNFFRQLAKNLSGLPGVRSVGVISHLPFDDSLPNWYGYYWPEGAPKQEQNTVMADHRSVLPGYFESVGATFIAGRDFDEFDVAENRGFAIVDDFLAEKAWSATSAVGKKLNIENGNFVRDTVEVIGVVKHLQSHSLTDRVRGQVYLLYPRAIRRHMALTIKSTAAPQTLLPFLQREVAKLDKDLPIYNVQPMESYVEKARRETRFTAMLAGVLALIALLLASTGIYGVTSYSVVQRTNEIGVRMALGAGPPNILRMVMRQGMFPVATGLFLGMVLSFVLTPLISGLLFSVHASDPVTLVASCAFFGGVGLLACYLPARRAVKVDPLVALRYE
jgi:predicted permease